MNDQCPTDPREQMEVRITALLLGEASAFEEAELLEAINHDPALAAYYEEMRRMVRRVEELIQLTPAEAATKQPALSAERRGKLEKLFNTPANRTIRLKPTQQRTRRSRWMPTLAEVAAIIAMLCVLAGMLFPARSSAKFKSRLARLEAERLGGGGTAAAGELDESRMQINQQLFEANAGLERLGSRTVASGLSASPTENRNGKIEYDDSRVARYGISQPRSERPLDRAPAKSAAIYLPTTDKEAVAVDSYSIAAQPASAAGQASPDYSRGAPANLRPAAELLLSGPDVVAVTLDSPAVSFSVPPAANLMVRSLAASAVSPPPQPKAAFAPAKIEDSLEIKPVIVLGSVLPSIQAGQPPARPVEEVDRLGAVRGKADDYVPGFASSEGRGTEAKDGLQLNGVAMAGTVSGGRGRSGGGGSGGAKPNADRWYFAQAGEVASAGVPVNQPAAAATLFTAQDIARTGSESVAQLPHNQLALGRKNLSEQAGARGEGGAVGRPVVEASVNQFSDFASALPVQSLAEFGNVRAARDGDVNGRQGTTELFAKVPAGPATTDVLVRSENFSAVATDAKLRDSFGDLNEPATIGIAIEREGVEAGQKAEAFGIELKRKTAEPEWLGIPESSKSGAEYDVAGISDRQELQTREFKVDPKVFYEGLEGVLANSVGARDAVAGARLGAPSFQSPVFAQVSIAQADHGEGSGRGLRFLTSTNDISLMNVATRDYLEAVGVNLTASSMVFYNDRTGMLMVKAPESELSKVQQAVEMLNYSPPRDLSGSTQSRFDTLADLSRSEFAFTSDNGHEQQLTQQVESATVAAPEVTKLAEEVVESQPATPPPLSLEPLPEISTKDNAFSTFSLNVSDVSFQLAASSLENGQMPDGARLRSEEFINAFDYRDPLPAPGQRVAFNWERARNPFAHNRELLRFSVQTAAAGREPGQPLNLVLLLDNSGSMERADRVQITEQMLRVLAAQLTGYDRVSFISFARTPRLIVDGAAGGNPDALLKQVTGLNPDGGTNLEYAMKLAYETAAKHFQANGNNRVILITDGAANLGNVDPQQLRERVIEQRKRGIALDCFGVGWEGYNDNLLESLSRNGDGRYGFLNDAENAPAQFASQLAGALQVAAADVKAQVEFNPNRVTVYRQIGYQQHQLTKEQFRDNTVDAAEIGAAEAGNALYSVQVNPNGSGPIGTFRVRYRVPATGLYEEKEWVLPFTPSAVELEKSAPAMRLASSAAAFAEWLASSPYAQTVTPDGLQNLLRGVPEVYAPDPRAAKLQAMIQQARTISGR